MNTAMIIASRELRDRGRILVVGAALALLPFLVALMPSAQSNRSLIIAGFGGGIAMSYALCLALMFGINTLGRELSEKRLSFYFSKPIAPAALWTGKTIAALVTVAGVALLVALPSFLAARGEWTGFWGREDYLVWKLIGITALFLYFGGHAIATVVRSRSILVAADFVLAVAMVFAAMLLVRPLLERGAVEHVFGVWKLLAGALLLILAIVPVAQLARGRTDIRRSHAAFSSLLWPAMGVCLAVASSYVLWATSPSLKAIDQIENLRQSTTGEWAIVTGMDATRGDIPTSFLINTKTGSSERVQPLRFTNAFFSRDGRTLVWLESDELLPRFGAARVYTRTLVNGAPNRATNITASMSDHLAISDDGTRIALLGRGQLRVHDLASGTMLAAAKLEQNPVKTMFFASPSTVRIVSTSRPNDTASILELDVAAKKLTKTGQFATDDSFGWHSLSSTPDGSTFYVNRMATIIDGRTGAVRTKLPIAPKTHRASVMLRDGRIVFVQDGVLALFDRAGARVREVKLPVANGLVLGETADGKVLVGGRLGKPAPGIRGRKVLKVDLARGAVVDVKEDVWGSPNWWGLDPRLPLFSANARYTGTDANGALTQWQ